MGLDVIIRAKDLPKEKAQKARETITDATKDTTLLYLDDSTDLWWWSGWGNPMNELFDEIIPMAKLDEWQPFTQDNLECAIDAIQETLDWTTSIERYPSYWRDIDIACARELAGLQPIFNSFPPGYNGLFIDDLEMDVPALEAQLIALKTIKDTVDLNRYPLEILFSF